MFYEQRYGAGVFLLVGHSLLLVDMASSYHSVFWYSKIDFIQQACVHLSSQESIV